ncbi:unnamed protein product [Adineta steineri]|uniref:G-protein coupled receptors family 1 profile domain-containing protein n=1 Tax=Adineta steineri TaxID=433720 RepID=A0A815C1G9_9BILA|nr:unnamed protein product [Adineta steineri]CAF3795575.1 unnamed protein product [Adineta steineri]
MAQTSFNYQIASLKPSSNISSTSTMSTILSNQNHIHILKWSVRIIGGLLITVGGIGNTLSALTLSRKKLRGQVTSIYLIALALSDLGNVFFSVLNFYLIRFDSNQNMRLYSNISCKFHIFFTYYFINLSPTLLVAVSVQRYLTIAKHHYSKKYCTAKNAYIVIGLICFLSLFLQLHWSIFYELQLIPNKQQNLTSFNHTIIYRRICNISSKYPSYLWFRSNILGYIQWFFFTLCPFVIMLILNSLILKVIASARLIQQRMNQKNQRKKAKQRNMTIMLLSISCVFILLTAPASTFMAFGHLFKNLHGQKSQSLWTMFSLIYYANTAANFILYFLTANVFRQEVRVMVLSFPGCSKIFPEQFELLRANTLPAGGVGRGEGGRRFETIRKTQYTTVPLVTSILLPSCNEEMNRKSSANSFLKVNTNNQFLNVTNTCNSSSGISYEEDSKL